MLPSGLYERVIDLKLRRALEALASGQVVENPLDDDDSHSILAQHLAGLLRRALDGVKGDNRLDRQIKICNDIIALLVNEDSSATSDGHRIVTPGSQLFEILECDHIAGKSMRTERPETPLSATCLLTATHVGPSLNSQLKRELLTANRVDILCSFIRWSGIRILEDELRAFTQNNSSRLRVITTSYMGLTEPRAVDLLRDLPNSEIKVSYDSGNKRLHAKAYLFYRDTGFGSAYIGSANLSKVALLEGLEWTVKVSQYDAPDLWEKIQATFETYWNDIDFTSYRANDRVILVTALSHGRAQEGRALGYNFDIKPYRYQEAILDELEADRVLHNRWKNLVVAATGTGKTVVAAFDYKRFRMSRLSQHLPVRLLFVAHRKEILEQSMACFRAVLRDQNFGELLVAEHEPTSIEYLFVSIQSYNSRRLWETIQADYYNFVVIDEFHHAEANSYKCLLDEIHPDILLALTATPERGDGLDILHHFGGHISAEIRLSVAIDKGLLCPFQYFGMTDSVALDRLTWQRGGYKVGDLDRVYTNNAERAALVLQAVSSKLLDPRHARGLGFCATVAHALFMASMFQQHGIPSEALSGDSPAEHRQTIQRRLVEREINFIFVVDLYNEGIDIPEIDTVLFLRPTESLTVFLQQLGRGLRSCEGKDCLTVLDFIGQAHRNYDFEMRFRALSDQPRQRIDREIEAGFPHVPLGCSIQLERVAQQYVLNNISRSLNAATLNLAQRIGRFDSDTGQRLTLGRFLDYYDMQIDDLYRRGSWTGLCRRAGINLAPLDPDADVLANGLRRMAHITGPNQIRMLLQILGQGNEPYSTNGLSDRISIMLFLSLWAGLNTKTKSMTIPECYDRLRMNPAHVGELVELLEYKYDKIATVPPACALPYECPLELHCFYTRDEILAAFGHWTLQNRPAHREGTLYLRDLRTDLFFITLNKTEKHYSPSTMYEDYAISDVLFHWQSQSTTAADSPTGRRYIEHRQRGNTVLLFVREDRTQNTLSCPFIFLGPANYESHSGSRPMSILWRLEHPIPARLRPITQRMAAP